VRLFILPLLLIVLFLVSVPSLADTIAVVNIPGIASIWLSNQPNGTATPYAVNYGPGIDVAPLNSPILVSLSVPPHAYLTFQSSGTTSRNPDPIAYPQVGPEGEQTNYTLPGAFSLSGLTAPYSSLVGVFLDSHQTYAVPPSLNFGSDQARSFATVSPQLQQVFFIGDGLTGVGQGDLQFFKMPLNADMLYLATFDSGSNDNGGELQVTVNRFPPGPPIPEPSTLTLLGIGILGLFGYGWRTGRRG
jgi:hypothetical protein